MKGEQKVAGVSSVEQFGEFVRKWLVDCFDFTLFEVVCYATVLAQSSVNEIT